MKTRLNFLRSRFAPLAAALLLLAAAPLPAAIDLNGNGLSDVWELLHEDAVDPAGDADGDGQSNLEESIFGTDPMVASNRFHSPALAFNVATGQLEVSWSSVAGKRYQLQTCGDLATGAWVNEGAAVMGTGATLSANRPPGSLSRLYLRVQVSDVDTDGDSLTNWEEITLGLDPNDRSNGTGSFGDGGKGTGNSAQANPVVTIVATQPLAAEDGPTPGKVTIQRSGATNLVLVGYSITGTATKNVDHTAVSAWVTLAEGVNSADVMINALNDSVLESSESVTVAISFVLSITPTVSLSIAPGSPSKATVIIANRSTATGTGLLGKYYDNASTTYTNAANFSGTPFSRVDPTVDLDWSYGTPNGNTLLTSADTYSVTWEAYLSPTPTGTTFNVLTNNYVFQLNAADDDKARVFLDANDGNGFVQILQNGWDDAATGTYKQSGTYTLTVPAGPANRYHIKVEFIETSGNATCGLQWKVGTAGFVNIPVSTTVNSVSTTNVFTDNVGTTAGWVGKYYDGMAMPISSNTLKSTQTDSAVTNGNNGFWGAGTPDPSIGRDTFSVRWTGQVQPQYSEEYTFVVNCDDAAKLWINGQPLTLRLASATSSSGTYNYNGTTGDTVVTHPNIPNGSFVLGETVRVDPTSGNLSYATGSTYSYDSVTGNAVITYSNLTTVAAGGFHTGETVYLDPTSGNLTSLASLPYPITADDGATTFTVNFGAGAFLDGTGSINIADVRDAVVTAVGTGTVTVSFGTGKSATGAGNCTIEAINKPVDWPTSLTTDRYARVTLLGGLRYEIRLDYFENTGPAKCQLSWYSPSQPKQIIPSTRLYPTSVAQQQAFHTGPTSAYGQVGGPISIAVSGSNGSTVSISGKPTWLTFSGGVLTGTPPAGAGGDYQMIITTTNAAGIGTSIINLHVDDNTDKPIAREYWTGVAGSTVADIPTSTAPTGSSNLASLEGPSGAGPNYGARIRGFLIAPVTGNYYFWIAANNAAELWISNDTEPVNAIKRASVTTGTASQQWSAPGETRQKSAFLALEAGQKYYLEILHKAGPGAGDNLAVGWAKPGESGTAPSQVVPGSALSTYVAAAPATAGTLYLATMLTQSGAKTNGVGSSTLRLSDDETYATMRYSYSGLTGAITSQHIHTDAYLTKPSTIVFDIDTPGMAQTDLGGGLQPDGSYKWFILPVGTLSAAEIREIIKEGKAYINLHTALYPAGEIRGNYTLAGGSRTFTVPPAAPSWTDDHDTDAGAVRFLTQATFGPNIADIAALKTNFASYDAWIEDQFTKPASKHLPEVLAREYGAQNGFGAFDNSLTFNAWWRNAISGDDQLRQRVAFALSEIHVVSGQGPLDNRADALSYFYDKLLEGASSTGGAFGNFRDILEVTTLTPTMGRYLDMLKNDRPDLSTGKIPNENYAREIMQLFSIGLYRMWPDGSLILNSQDEPVATYTQREIVGVAHVFTGWDYGYNGAYRTTIGASTSWIRQMREVPARHDSGPKRILNNEVLPGLTAAGGQAVDQYATHVSTQYNDPAYQALPQQELDAVQDQLFNHPNTGPFICRQLIQRMVTSNPSRDYLYRVVSKFNDNGSGVRGDMKAVIKAILLDYEARSPDTITKNTYGKQREAVLRTANAARAFRPNGSSGSFNQLSGSHVINITGLSNSTLVGGNTAYLEFPTATPASGKPTSEAYTVLSTPPPNANSFSVNAKGWIGVSTSNGSTNNGFSGGTYSIPVNSTVMTVTLSSHWLGAGQMAWLDFGTTSVVGPAMTDGIYTTATSNSIDNSSGGVPGTTFTVTVASNAALRSGLLRIPRFQASYIHTSSGLAAPNERRVTISTLGGTSAPNNDHHLAPGDHVFINTTAGLFPVVDSEYIIDKVTDANTFTILTDAAHTSGTNGDNENQVFLFPLSAQPTGVTGTVNSLPSTFNMNNTDGDIDQTPLNSPTVFNFFLPDFKYPGALASVGITTPEFQDTAETSVVRSSNFVFNAMFTNSSNTNGIASFKSATGGSNGLVLDLSPWMATGTQYDDKLGAAPVPGEAWTSNANVSTLISHFNTLLNTRMSAAAQTIISNFVAYERTISSIPVSNNCRINTSAAHGLATGDYITLSGISGGTFQNSTTSVNISDINTTWKVTVAAPGSSAFTLDGVKCTSISGLNLTSARTSYVPYANSNPTDTNKRDRLRSILHLILTSPDYTIQR